MSGGKVRIKDVAKMAGVSATTVSNVIHGRTDKVSKKTRKKIEEILNEQEYAPSMGARILSGKCSRMVAVVVRKEEWKQENKELEEILYEIERRLYEREYYMLLHFAKTAEEFVRYTAAWKLDGAICIWFDKEECARIRQRCEIPVAMIGRENPIYGRAGEEVARFLIKREGLRIWFLDGTEESGKMIWQGIRKIFSRKGICLEEDRYLEIPKDRDLRKMFYKIRLAGLAFLADILVFASADHGAEAVGYLHDLEIKVPEEIEVMAIGQKEETALICRPQLTTVEFDKKRFVRQAIEELYVQMIKGYILTKSGKISVKTIIRDSSN